MADDLVAARARRWWAGRRKVGRIERAAAFVEDLGFALLFPNKGVALPSLYDVASDRPLFSPAGDWGPDADRVWRWKDELPRRGLAWYGKYLRGRPSLLAPSLLADLYPRRGRPDDFEDAGLSPAAYRVARILLRSGPQSTAALREALDVEAEGVRRLLPDLGERIARSSMHPSAWRTRAAAGRPRCWSSPPAPSASPGVGATARLRAARRYLDTMLVARPYELGNAFGWGADGARAALDRLVQRRHALADPPSYRSLAFPP